MATSCRNGVENEREVASDGRVFLNVDAKIMQIGRLNGITYGSMQDSTTSSYRDAKNRTGSGPWPVLREHQKPDGRLSVGRSRTGFPDFKYDHLVQLLICKNQQGIREAFGITDKYEIIVTVTYDGMEDSERKMPDFQYQRIKSETKSGANRSMIGVVGYVFRFHEPDTKYKIRFALQTALPRKQRKKKIGNEFSTGETVSEISFTLETGSAPVWKRRKAKGKKARKIPPSFKLGPASLSKESMELCKRSSWVMKQLQSCRDNAKWDDFEKFSAELLLEFPETDTQITIKLEQSVAACYRNDLERSLQFIDEAFKLMPQATNVDLLAGRGYGYRAGVKRRQGNLGEADCDVQRALQNNCSCQTNIDTSFLVYEKASVLLDFIGRTPQRSRQQVNEALLNLEMCIDVCRKVELQDKDLYVKKHHFALIKIAMLLLDCRTEAARDRVLSEEFIIKGQECLCTLKTKYWSEIPEGVKIQFNLASSDLEYRRGCYSEAEKFASLAKERAIELGFNTEISHAQDRLDHMRAITRDHGTIGNSPWSLSATHAISASDGDISSSGSESDSLRILEILE